MELTVKGRHDQFVVVGLVSLSLSLSDIFWIGSSILVLLVLLQSSSVLLLPSLFHIPHFHNSPFFFLGDCCWCCWARVRLSKERKHPDNSGRTDLQKTDLKKRSFFFVSRIFPVFIPSCVVLSLHSSSSFRCYVGECRVFLNDAMYIISRAQFHLFIYIFFFCDLTSSSGFFYFFFSFLKRKVSI